MQIDDDQRLVSPPLPASGGTVAQYDVSELLRGGREAVLVHNGSKYRLRITSNDRLILTK